MTKKYLVHFFLLIIMVINGFQSISQANDNRLWHVKQREIHYTPDGEDFLLVNGSRRFNRALYGGNTAFRVEAGDLPEFALYLPGMGGNLKFGLIRNNKSKWLINASKLKTRYRPGSMLYAIEDSVLGNGTLNLTVLSLFDREGLLVKLEAKNIPSGVQLLVAYGGATGTKFSRDGDIGADPESSFYLKPEYCISNSYQITNNAFKLFFGAKPLTEEERYEIQHKQNQIDTSKRQGEVKTLGGIFPPASQLKLGDAAQQESPLNLYSSNSSATPVLTSIINLSDSIYYFFIQNKEIDASISYASLPFFLENAEKTRKEIAGRIKINTPDPFMNTLGAALSIADDAVWEDPSYMHGAIAWRMRLNGWRGAYAADVLGLHHRGRMHFESYSRSQLTSPLSAPVVMDTALHLGRALEKLGTSLFSSGYISRNPNGDFRPHHYDMNLVFVDQLLNHFMWTGDTAFIRKMWPLLQRHLDWEKRNFDVDGDGLYDSYAAIWASDALQYSGGGVTHSSAYNYRSNLLAADIAKLLGQDPSPYKKEADKILQAINNQLWMKDKGWYAEYKDLLGKQLLHPSAAVWTIYHALDSKIQDPFQAWQSLYYIDKNIPHIPIKAKGLSDTSLYTISTTNWQPYTWSLNNVALAEIMHTALAYWQGGRKEEAFQLWKSSLMESMYLGASPGNMQQLSFYDAIRGELYRDFADPIAMTARSTVEGLFGIFPDALHGYLTVKPGFPAAWNHASITTADIDFSFKRTANKEEYNITPRFPKKMNLHFILPARMDGVESILINGKPVKWAVVDSAIETPLLKLILSESAQYKVAINWKGRSIQKPVYNKKIAAGEVISVQTNGAVIMDVFDPQNLLSSVKKESQKLVATVMKEGKGKSFFIQLKQGSFTHWMPIAFDLVKPIEIGQDDNRIFLVRNNSSSPFKGDLEINHTNKIRIDVPAQSSKKITLPQQAFVTGSNHFQFNSAGKNRSEVLVDWDKQSSLVTRFEKINLYDFFNDAVTNIFNNQYLSPRPKVSTVQLPIQGIGNWAYPLTTANINDSGLRKKAGTANEIMIEQGIPFRTPSSGKNILFTSQWDNYPDSVSLPLTGKAVHAYFLMAGSTNAMQSRMVNGEVVVYYTDGSTETLQLINPRNWWPIEQDYYIDDFAFTSDAPKPVRVYLKTGKDSREFNEYTTIKGFSNMAIDGGAATVLDLPLNPTKDLKSLVLKTITNDVVIGLMSVTLVRP